jgi:hypothetical protein
MGKTSRNKTASRRDHVPKPSCTGDGALLAFDGGVVDLATHEVWALCQSMFCRYHPNCHGVLAASDVANPEKPSVFRVRNQRDLKRHLSPGGNIGASSPGVPGTDTDLNASTRIVVFPKGTFKGRPKPEHILDPSWLPTFDDPSKVAASGSTSVRQSRQLKKFPITADLASRLTAIVSAYPLPPRFTEESGVASALRNRARNYLESLSAKYGGHHVVQQFIASSAPGPDGRPLPLGLACDITERALADREGVARLARVTSPGPLKRAVKASETILPIPSAELAELDPYPGQAVADRLHVDPRDAFIPHGAFRFFDRVLDGLDKDDVVDALAKRPVAAEIRARAARFRQDLPALLADLLHEGVFATSATHTPIDADLRTGVARLGGRPSRHVNRVVVTVPHPFVPGYFLELVGEVSRYSKHPQTGRKSFGFRLVTVTEFARDGALLEEVTDVRPAAAGKTPPHRRGVFKRGTASYSSVSMLAAAPTPGVADKLSPQDEKTVREALGFV